ncbi:uncharacterized protein JCM15063_003618 [Sporobolomyces koalae]|uniref:uncharacterized protein n=1 Tax=Sporobolomyces koalae TaxID=500713 RepID=UPI00316C8408
MQTPRARRSSNSVSSSSTSATTSVAASINSSYTASLPATYRRSSFPVSPAIHLAKTTTTPTGTSINTIETIPAGISFELRGCRDDDDYERATGSVAPFYSPYPATATRSQSVDRPGSNADGSRNGWLSQQGRSWSHNSGVEKQKREAIKGWEDPALAAARRALWDDIVDDESQRASTDSANEEAVEFDDDDDDKSSNVRDNIDAKNRSQPEANDSEVEEEDEEEEEEEEEEDETIPPPRPPCHSTLSPGPSCLRSRHSSSSSPSPRIASLSLHQPPDSSSIERQSSPCPSSSTSSSSMTTTTTATTAMTTSSMIRFSQEPPRTCPTYSKLDYERKGDLPVEKLSIREWIELQGVREAVGVWSGKIQKWEEEQDGRATDEASKALSGSTISTHSSHSGSTVTTGPGSSRPSLSLAALTGVVTVSKSTPSSPT